MDVVEVYEAALMDDPNVYLRWCCTKCGRQTGMYTQYIVDEEPQRICSYCLPWPWLSK